MDPHASATFRRNFPGATFIEAPVSRVDPLILLDSAALRPGELDCLIGGPPCQSFSYNNRKRSVTDERAQLFRDYLRLVRRLAPRTLVMENVPGILTIGEGAVIEEITRRLAKLGYAIGVRILYAEDYGVPQERRRVFIVGTRLGWDWSLFPNGSHGPTDKPSPTSNPFVHRWSLSKTAKRRALVTVWDAIGDLPPLCSGGGADSMMYAAPPRTEYQARLRRGSTCLLNHVTSDISDQLLRRIERVPEAGNWRDIPRYLLPAGMRRARLSDHTKRYGRLDRTAQCCTILTKCDPHWGGYIHPRDDRVISVREAARLQSFPDRFRFVGGRSEQYRQVGNAVPPLMAAALGRSLKHHIQH